MEAFFNTLERFRDPSVAYLWRPLEGVFPVPKAVLKSTSRYAPVVDGFLKLRAPAFFPGE
jgi:hypothetical protein